MTLTMIWRTRLYGAIAAAVAPWLAYQIAEEEYFWPVAIACALAGVAIVYLQPRPLTTLLIGGALVGYIVGNRGFAQLSLAGRLPLFPGEFVLLTGGAALFLGTALRQDSPIRRDALNIAILAWA